MAATPRSGHILVQSLSINHITAGDAESAPVIMLHGWGANAELVWPLAQCLMPHYRVCVPDLPGFGRSQQPLQAWSIHDYARFVLAYLDQQGIERAYLFGHSFGGRLGLILGAEHPGRFIKMALADSAGVRPKTPVTTRTRLQVYKGVRDGLKAIGLGSLSDRLRAWYTTRYGSPDFKSAGGIMREIFVKVVNEDLLPYAARVSIPTLLLWGDQDMDTPLSHGKLLEKTIPNAGLVVLTGAGHYSYLDRLADTTRIVDYFFKQT